MVQVCNSVRDLGGHLNFGIALCGITFTDRLRRAITMARALAHTPWGHASRVSLIHMLILPLACYGSEAAPPADNLMTQPSSAIAACLAPHNAHTSNCITYMVATKRCCEPGAYLLWRKLMLFRRFLAKHPQAAALCEDTISRYARAGLPGSLTIDAPLPCLPAAPPLGTGFRSAWTAQAHSVARPLGLLCTALSEFRAAMRLNFACAAFPHIISHATRLPRQHVHRHVDILASEVLSAAA